MSVAHDPTPKPDKDFGSKRLREPVGQIIFRGHVENLDQPFVYSLPDKMIANVDVFWPRIINQVIGNENRRLIVAKNGNLPR